MAYMLSGKGPFANLQGEFARNHYEVWTASLSMRIWGHHEVENEREGIDWTKFRKGRPRPTESSTTEQLEARGYFGLYLKHDITPDDQSGDGPIDFIPTPECLIEPPPLCFPTRQSRRRDERAAAKLSRSLAKAAAERSRRVRELMQGNALFSVRPTTSRNEDNPQLS